MSRALNLVAAAVFLTLCYAGARGAGPLPPLGSLLDPANGVWAVAAAARLPARVTAPLGALDDSVTVLYDPRGVPHVFARTRLDAIRALGYVVARDRLFQLEVQTRAAAGTLTELVGDRALAEDRRQRRLDLARSAQREYAAMTPAARRSIDAFAEGVNAYRDAMTARDVPLEYRLLGKQPFRWRPVYSVYLHRRMGYTLSYRTDELRRERVVELVGERAADALFPVHAPIVEPIVPGGREYPVFDSSPLPHPEVRVGMGGRGRPTTGRPGAAYDAGGSRGAPVTGRPEVAHDAGGSRGAPTTAYGRLWPPGGDRLLGMGSNTWAVGAAKSATGHALLAGDPHLDLTLPSIWYEVHLVARAELDVYGVTIPGAPGVVIGFNRDVAWSFANTQSDVMDYYAETLDDRTRPERYRLDGEWRPLERRIETFHGPDGAVLAVDTIYHTHRGPVVWWRGRPYSLRWTVLESRDSWAPFDAAQSARSATEWLEAMRAFDTPPQNAVVADRGGTIASGAAGWYPLRPGGGRGDVIRDGSTSASDWVGRVAAHRVPLVRDPAQGYVASANQEPHDPRDRSDYFAADWYAPWRALRINQLLRAAGTVSADDMRRFQTDPRSVRAELFVPLFLAAAAEVAGDGAGGADDAAASAETLRAAARLLGEWDRRYAPDDRRAVLFEMAMGLLEARTWDELEDPATGRRVWTPSEAVLWRLTHDARSPWWDVRATGDRIETRDDVLAASLRDALVSAREHHGDPGGDGWRWDRVQTANIYHLLFIPSLSALRLPVQGGPGTLSSFSGRGTHGASWRMVVELGPEVRAWATYPGGQSGNPVSPWYDDRIPSWVAGELAAVAFPKSVAELAAQPVASRVTLIPGGR